MVRGELPSSRPVVIVDRNAGHETGHHRHWLELVVNAVDPAIDIVVVRAREGPSSIERAGGRTLRIDPIPDRPSRSHWYFRALAAAARHNPRALILMSGDDALPAMVREWRTIRGLDADVSALMFRLSPQPHPSGRFEYSVKLAGIQLLRLGLPRLRLYALELPVGRRKRIPRVMGLRSITDSSGAEQAPGMGHSEARISSQLGDVQGPVVLTIGMLGPGKHIDTLLAAWRSAPLASGRLLFAGQADPETDRLLTDAASHLTGVEYRPGRLTDQQFDQLVEAADVVCAIYRYSASSGVVLRALALGSQVLAGGSRSLEYALAGVPGVTLVHRPDPHRVAEAMSKAASLTRPVPATYRRTADEFPSPLVTGLTTKPMSPPTQPAIELIRCRRTSAPQESVVADAEAAFMRAGLPVLGSGQAHPALDNSGRVLGRLGLARRLLPPGPTRVVTLLGPAERQLLPHAIAGSTAWYVWDCWPDAQRRWASMFRRWRPTHVFFAARAAAEYWRPLLPFAEVRWSPEAVEPAIYLPGPDLAQRSIPLLEMGRRHEQFHDRASRHMTARAARHVHSSPQLQFVFPRRSDLVAGLQDSVASVCFPASKTHSQGRTADWESMTHRYLEAAATRTLIVGAIPQEMRDLFGFSPGVDVDPACPEDLLDRLIDDPGQFQGLVDQTYRRLLEVGTWDVRVGEILSALRTEPPRT